MSNAPAIQACRSCGGDIYWLKNVRTGKVGPIDARPAPGGNVTIDLTDDTYCVWGPAERREMDPSTLHRNHFATCGQAAHWHRHGSRNDTTVMEVPHAHA